MNHPRPWICLLAGLTSSQLVWLCLSANLSTMPMSKFSFILSTYYSLASWQVIRGTALQRSMKERSQLSTFLLDAQLFTVRVSYWFLIFIPKKMSRRLPKMRGKTSFLCAWGFFTGKTYTTVRIKSRTLEKKEKNLLIHVGNLYFLRTNASKTEYIFHRGNIAAGFRWVFQYIWSFCKHCFSQRWALSIISISILAQVGLSASRYSYRRKYFISVQKR